MWREDQESFVPSGPGPFPHAGRLRGGVILHPTDYSGPSRQAFGLACRFARGGGSRLIVLHVAEPVRVPSLGMAPAPPLPGGYRGAWESRLRLLRPAEPGVPVEYRLEEGDPAAEILRVARETSCDLIVMGTRGHTGLRRLLNRSVARRVRRGAACPVVTVTLPPNRRGEPGRQSDAATNGGPAQRPADPGGAGPAREAGGARAEWVPA